VFSRFGPAEVILILGLVIVLFGAKKLPELGRSLGMTLREFRKSTQEADKEPGAEEEPEEKREKASEPARS